MLGLIYTVLTASSYNHITDAPYIDRFDSSIQLAFANLSEMLGYLSRAIGTFICGIGIVSGLRYNFVIAFIFTSLSTIFAYLALYSINKERMIK